MQYVGVVKAASVTHLHNLLLLLQQPALEQQFGGAEQMGVLRCKVLSAYDKASVNTA